MSVSADGLQAPPGDPAAVFAAAAKLMSLATGTDRMRTSVGAQAVGAVGALTNPRAADVAEAAGAVTQRLEAAAGQFALAGRVLHDYGVALAAAKAAVASISARHWEEGVTARRLADRAPDSAAVEMALIHSAQRQAALAAEAQAAHREVLLAAHRAATVLDAGASIAVPGAAGMTPQQILAKALADWNDIVKGATTLDNGYQAFKNVFDPADATRGLLGAPNQVRAAYAILERWKDAENAELLLRQTTTFENAMVDSYYRVLGDPNNSSVFRRYMLAQQNISRSAATADAADLALVDSERAFVDTVKLTSKFAKVTGVLAIVGGAADLANPSHDGWRGIGDRVSGAISAGAGTTALAATFSTAAFLGPVGAGIVAGALVVTAVWTAGNFVYDHWDGITGGTAKASHWVGDKVSDTGGWASDKASDAGRWAEDRASDAWNGVTGLFG